MPKQLRILADTVVDGVTYKPNQVVELDDKVAKSIEASGAADSNKDAVAYCINDLGAQVINHAEAIAKAEVGEQPQDQGVGQQ